MQFFFRVWSRGSGKTLEEKSRFIKDRTQIPTFAGMVFALVARLSKLAGFVYGVFFSGTLVIRHMAGSMVGFMEVKQSTVSGSKAPNFSWREKNSWRPWVENGGKQCCCVHHVEGKGLWMFG